jgi:hypothetical protein
MKFVFNNWLIKQAKKLLSDNGWYYVQYVTEVNLLEGGRIIIDQNFEPNQKVIYVLNNVISIGGGFSVGDNVLFAPPTDENWEELVKTASRILSNECAIINTPDKKSSKNIIQ